MEKPEGFLFPFPSAERAYSFDDDLGPATRRRRSKRPAEREAIVGTVATPRSSGRFRQTYLKPAIVFLCFLIIVGLVAGLLIYFVFGQTESDACSYSEEPTAYDILRCERYKEGVSCGFDTSQCTTTCDLGFEQNQYGCQMSCDCALGGILQTDVAFTPVNIQSVLSAYIIEEDSVGGVTSSGGTILQKSLWNLHKIANRWRIPYIISSEIVDTSLIFAAIQNAMKAISSVTCIDFYPRLSDIDYIEFSIFGHGCRSAVGRVGGRQAVALGSGCNYSGVIQHQLMHVLGFWHEDSRPDRDEHITVLLDNVAKDNRFNFKKIGRTYLDTLNSSYDISSIMHLDGFALSDNKQPVIMDKTSGKPVKALRSKLSVEDAKRVNHLYECEETAERSGTGYWAQWSGWFPCSATCGSGRRVKLRECLNSKGLVVWHERCKGLNRMYKECNVPSCNEELWGQWSSCSVTCGIGQMHRTSCCYPRESYELSPCNVSPCPTLGVFSWGLWSSWLSCSRTCGKGWRKRTRKCVDRFYVKVNATQCPQTIPSTQQRELCSVESCNVRDTSGQWADWGLWSDCSVTCGNGKTIRERTCDGSCLGEKAEKRVCGVPCPVVGTWGEWSAWGSCFPDCNGVMERKRTCLYLHNQIVTTCVGGTDKIGRQRQQQNCSMEICLTDASSRMVVPDAESMGWSTWSNWSPCDRDCKPSVQWRVRKCVGAEENCQGRASQAKPCDLIKCKNERLKALEKKKTERTTKKGNDKLESTVVKAVWSVWSIWSACSVICGNGKMIRVRSCYGVCRGHNREEKYCGALCPVEGSWSDWSQWTLCTLQCKGERNRFRTCFQNVNHVVTNCKGGTDDEGKQTQFEKCSLQSCLTDEPRINNPLTKVGWSEWTGWTSCSTSCLNGVQWRLRKCFSATRVNCTGRSTEAKVCNLGLCKREKLKPKGRSSVMYDASKSTTLSHPCGGDPYIADLNGDSKPDIFCVEYAGLISVTIANASSSLSNVTWSNLTFFCIVGELKIADYDGDTSDDVICRSKKYLYVAKWKDEVLNHNLPTTVVLPDQCEASQLVFGSFDSTPKLDVLCFYTFAGNQTIVFNP